MRGGQAGALIEQRLDLRINRHGVFRGRPELLRGACQRRRGGGQEAVEHLPGPLSASTRAAELGTQQRPRHACRRVDHMLAIVEQQHELLCGAGQPDLNNGSGRLCQPASRMAMPIRSAKLACPFTMGRGSVRKDNDQPRSSSPAFLTRWRDISDPTWLLCLAIQASASASVANALTVVG
jgi:hypothetical protein